LIAEIKGENGQSPRGNRPFRASESGPSGAEEYVNFLRNRDLSPQSRDHLRVGTARKCDHGPRDRRKSE
jgi:hypothetical protein